MPWERQDSSPSMLLLAVFTLTRFSLYWMLWTTLLYTMGRPAASPATSLMLPPAGTGDGSTPSYTML